VEGGDEEGGDEEGEDEEEEMLRLRRSAGYVAFEERYRRDLRRKEGDAVDDMEASNGEGDHAAEDGEMWKMSRGMDDTVEDAGRETIGIMPLSSRETLGSSHQACVAAISLDSAGSRFASGSMDHSMKLWDFGSMDRRLLSFREVEPLETFPVQLLRFSKTGGKILVGGGSPSVKVLDRDGIELYSCPEGDRYLHDMSQTKGHTAPLAGAEWHPTDPASFFTIAGDATVRIWNLEKDKAITKHSKLIKIRATRGQKVNPTAMLVDSSGSKIVVGCSDSSLRQYDTRSYSPRATGEVTEACSPGTEFSSLCASHDDTLYLGRSTDDCLRIWDARNLDQPLKCFQDLENVLGQIGAAFSPDGNMFATGTSVRKGSKQGASIVFFDRVRLEESGRVMIDSARGSVGGINWCSPINQLLYGTSDGAVHVLYDEDRSNGGILNCLAKNSGRSKADAIIDLGPGKIYTPNALPMFQDDEVILAGRVRKRMKPEEVVKERDRATKKPTPPSQVFVKPMGSTLASYLAQGGVKNTWREEDPQEALLRMEEKARDKPIFTGGALLNQPTLLASKTAEQEEEEAREHLLKRIPLHARKEKS